MPDFHDVIYIGRAIGSPFLYTLMLTRFLEELVLMV